MVRRYDGWPTWARAHRALADRLAAGTVDRLDAAHAFAAERHGAQRRPAGEPYVRHLREALEILLASGQSDPDLLVAALLHDVVEDTPTTLAEVRDRFGDGVAEAVGWLTKPEPAPGEDPDAVRAAYLHRLTGAPTPVLGVKLADRYSNVQRLDTHPRPESRQRYYRETVDHFVPLAGRIPFYQTLFGAWAEEYRHLAG